MQTEKIRIIQLIESFPDNKLQEAINAIDNINNNIDAPSSITVKTKEDFHRFVKRGLDDIKAGRIYSLKDTIEYTNNL